MLKCPRPLFLVESRGGAMGVATREEVMDVGCFSNAGRWWRREEVVTAEPCRWRGASPASANRDAGASKKRKKVVAETKKQPDLNPLPPIQPSAGETPPPKKVDLVHHDLYVDC
mmetsp:Transcript_16398/g.47136  ORF Transcript_16398/g.47136 Transcript_16398/m.47136 type:complete len:114 (-) Transcript_16398:54-395(-)